MLALHSLTFGFAQELLKDTKRFSAILSTGKALGADKTHMNGFLL
jgi:hypothetical protein